LKSASDISLLRQNVTDYRPLSFAIRDKAQWAILRRKYRVSLPRAAVAGRSVSEFLLLHDPWRWMQSPLLAIREGFPSWYPPDLAVGKLFL